MTNGEVEIDNGLMLDWSLIGVPKITDELLEVGGKGLFYEKGTKEVEPGPAPPAIMKHDFNLSSEF